jgi:DNA polymerase
MSVSARQAAYLRALGVDVYTSRGSAPLLEPDPQQRAIEPPEALHDTAVPQRQARRSEPAPPVQGAQPRPAAAAPGLDWVALRAAVAACAKCELHAGRTQTVFGVGDPRARWMFIGEAPGVEEDRQGEPFVGRAGQLLNAMIRAVGLRREDVYIANVVKCRPPGNRDPRPAEAASCRAFLERQVELIDPTLVVAVGRIAAQNLLGTDAAIGKLRGKVHSFGARPWPLVVVYHPAYLLRTPSEKRRAWQDLLLARRHHAQVSAGEAARGNG